MATNAELREFLNSYSSRLTDTVIGVCNSNGVGFESFMKVDELEEKWVGIAPGYVADAVKEFNDYPSVALAWAGYLGMGMAKLWDVDWEAYGAADDFYSLFLQPRGFDAMDEYIMEDVFGLTKGSAEYDGIVKLWQQLADSALTLMRRENVASQSMEAYYLLVATVEVFYLAGISIALSLMGYKYEKMVVGE